MVVLVTCKNEEDQIKKKALGGHNIIDSFLRCSRGANSIIGDGILRIQTHPSFYSCPSYLQE